APAAHGPGLRAGLAGAGRVRPGRARGGPAVVRGADRARAGLRLLLLLAAQRPALPGAGGARARRVVLRAGAGGGAAARLAAPLPVLPISPLRERGRCLPPARRAGVRAAGRGLVRAVLHPVLVQAADLRPAGAAPSRAGAGPLPDAGRLEGLTRPGAGRRGRLRPAG